MQKILFATGQQDLDNAIMSSLANAIFENVGYVDYNDVLLNRVEECKPDILVLSNYLQGSLNNLELALSIKEKFDNTRLVFLTSKEEIGSRLLKKLVIYNIYDFIAEDTWLLDKIVELIQHPVKFSKVKIYLEEVKEKNKDLETKEEGMPEFNKGVNIKKGELTDLSSIASSEPQINFDITLNEGDFIGYKPVLNPPKKILSSSSKPKLIKQEKNNEINISSKPLDIKQSDTKQTVVTDKKNNDIDGLYLNQENLQKENNPQVSIKEIETKTLTENKNVNILGTNGLKIDKNNQVKIINKPKIVPLNEQVIKENLVVDTKENKHDQQVKSEKDQIHKFKKPTISFDKEVINEKQEINKTENSEKLININNNKKSELKTGNIHNPEKDNIDNENKKENNKPTNIQKKKTVTSNTNIEVKDNSNKATDNKKKQAEPTKNKNESNINSNPINTNKKKYLYVFVSSSVITSCTSLNIAVGLSKFNNSKVLYITNRQNFAYYCCNRSRLQDKRLSKLNIFKLFNSKYSKINMDMYYVEHGADVQMLINKKEKEYDDIVLDVDLMSPYFEAYFLELVERFDYKMYVLLPHDRIAIEHYKKSNANDLIDYKYKIVIENCVEGGFSIKNISQLIGKDVLKTKSNSLKAFDDLNNQTTEFMRKDVVKNSDYEELYLDCIK